MRSSVRIGKIAMEEERTDEDDAGAANPVDELELTSAAPAAADGGNSNSGHADAVDLCFAREPRLVYARFPPDIPERQVFLTFPVLCALCSFSSILLFTCTYSTLYCPST